MTWKKVSPIGQFFSKIRLCSIRKEARERSRGQLLSLSKEAFQSPIIISCRSYQTLSEFHITAPELRRTPRILLALVAQFDFS